jgi:hypothetical protein
MKLVTLAALSLLVSIGAQAADTAYNALRVVGKQNAELLNNVVEVRGRNGSPQPDVWKITVDDPKSRGGVREFEVQRGRIISERAPTSRTLGSRMNFNQLNLDSEGVFTIVNQEATKSGVPFDRVEYLLKAGTGGGAPVWEVSLSERGAYAGRMALAADTGAVLDNGLRVSAAPRGPDRDHVERRTPPVQDREYADPAPRYNPDRDYVDRRPEPDEDRGGRDRWSKTGEPFRGIDDFFHRVGKRFQRRGDQLKNFFEGEERDYRDR